MIDRSHALHSSPAGEGARDQPGQRLLSGPTDLGDADLALMRRIDELHLEHPFAGQPDAAGHAEEGREVGRRHVSTLMKKMGVEAIYRRPNTSLPVSTMSQ